MPVTEVALTATTFLWAVAACAVPLLDSDLPLTWGCARHGEIVGDGVCPVERLAELACARIVSGPWRATWFGGALALRPPDDGETIVLADAMLSRFGAALHAEPIGAPVTARTVCRALLAAVGLFAI